MLQGLQAVVRFESARSLTTTRCMVWCALAVFPAALVTIIRSANMAPVDARIWTFFLAVLCCGVVTLLGLMLWAAPLMQSELEANTWVYVAVRPAGRLSLLWGRYVVAVIWSLTASWTALLLSFPLAQPPDFLRALGVLSMLSLLTAIGFGAAYSLIAVLFHRRAMALCLAYTFVFEVLISAIPAVINQLTLQFRLRCIMIRWLGWDGDGSGIPVEMQRFLFSELPAWAHVLALLGMSVFFLAASSYFVTANELVTTDE